jgi:N-acetyl-alpha-D-muramate 1-phosphate uridylyltransferase
MQIAILAGGLGTRLYPVTKNIPKPMVRVHGRPFLYHQIELLKKNNINDILLCLGYKASQIRDYFGNGKKFGVNITYSFENRKLLGTAGALKRAQVLLEKDFLVMYGDSYLPINFQNVFRFHRKIRKAALMTVFRNKNRLDKSNLVVKGKTVVRYEKNSTEKMEYIDYGLSVLNRKVIEVLPKNKVIQLEEVFKELAAKGQLAAYKVKKPFYEIGSKEGLKRFKKFLNKVS